MKSSKWKHGSVLTFTCQTQLYNCWTTLYRVMFSSYHGESEHTEACFLVLMLTVQIIIIIIIKEYKQRQK